MRSSFQNDGVSEVPSQLSGGVRLAFEESSLGNLDYLKGKSEPTNLFFSLATSGKCFASDKRQILSLNVHHLQCLDDLWKEGIYVSFMEAFETGRSLNY